MTTKRTLITGADVVLPDGTQQVDVLIDGATIAGIDPPSTVAFDERIEATGLHLIPGVIDDQVHFREPGLEYKEDLSTASHACAKGGVTTFLEMPNTNPTTTSIEALHNKLNLAATKSIVNYGFYIGATLDNLEVLKQAKRTPGIKIFIGSSTGNMLVDEQDVLERIFAETTLSICAHCEDETTVRANSARLDGGTTIHDHSRIRDHNAAIIATKRAVDLATRHKHHFHVLHVSTADEVAFLREGHEYITAEVCPHHLFFNIDDYDRLESRIQMNPSIKTAADNKALWAGLLDGTINLIATDHAPHTLEEKAKPYPESPSGLPAIENSLALMLNEHVQGKCSLEQIVEWMCTAPARTWSIANKGQIKEGFDADLVLIDLAKTQTVRDEEQLTKSKWSPWHGIALTGWPVHTFVMGQTAFVNGCIQPNTRGHEAQYQRSK